MTEQTHVYTLKTTEKSWEQTLKIFKQFNAII